MQRECDIIEEYEDKAVSTLTKLKYRSEFYEKKRLKNGGNDYVSVSGGETRSSVDEGDNIVGRQEQAGSVGSTPTVHSGSSSRGTNIRLPKLELKKFGGNVADWLPFWEQYKVAIHQNGELSSADKFNYLQSLLTDKAASCIAGFTPTENCYIDAITLLKEQFGNTEKIIEKLMRDLMALEPLNSSSNTSGLRKMYNLVTSNMRSLDALNVSSLHYERMLKTVILKSLPSGLRVEFYRRVNRFSNNQPLDQTNANESVMGDGSENQLKNLLQLIRSELEALEMASVEKESEKKATTSHLNRNENSVNVSTASSLLTTEANNKDWKSSCWFCNSGDHLSRNCNGSQTVDQRKQILRKMGKCFKCLRTNHMARDCRSNYIKCDKCSGKHVTAMCNPVNLQLGKKNNENNESNENKEINNQSNEKTVNLLIRNENVSGIFLQTAYVYVSKENNSENGFVRIILDSGSHYTFIKQSVSRQLNLPVIGCRVLRISPFGASKLTSPVQYNLVSMCLKSQFGQGFVNIEAIEVPEICVDVLTAPNENYLGLREFELADTHPETMSPVSGISILIGADNYSKIVTGEQKFVSEGMIACNTLFGWTLIGSIGKSENGNNDCAVPLLVSVEEELCFNMWSLESIGIIPEETDHSNITEDYLQNKVRRTSTNDRYEAQLPWKSEKASLHDNRNNALYRLRNLVRKLSRSSQNLEEYHKAISMYLDNGFAERVPIESQSSRTYYMPHRGVYREDKITTKLRVVFDASAHDKGTSSLNDNLWPGENINLELYSILLNFRLGRIALTADIEKAFLQIQLADQDKDVHRFLWFQSNDQGKVDTSRIAEFRMTRVTFGVTSSPFILAATLSKHLQLESTNHSEVCEIMKRSFYVDDFIGSTDDEDKAVRIFHESRCILSGAGMNLRGWNSNISSLRKLFQQESVSAGEQSNKVLGIWWCNKSDELAVDFKENIGGEKEYSKRKVLSTLAKIYDPLGMLSPFTVRMKLLFQKTWELNLTWDEILPVDLLADFVKLHEEFRVLNDISVRRCVFDYSVKSSDRITLHVFADASLSAYGAVAYLRQENESGLVSVNFLCAKNRLTPLKRKNLSLAQLELTAATIAARLQRHIKKILTAKIEKTFLWSDSQITLFWILGNPSKWKPYVKNRVQEIQDITERNDEWRYCPGELNSADWLTRGVKAQKLAEADVWWKGPQFLMRAADDWPSVSVPESKNVVSTLALFLGTEEGSTDEITIGEPLWPIQRCSDLSKGLRITVKAMRFIKKLRPRTEVPMENCSNEITAEEIEFAEQYWIKFVQKQEYGSEILSLKKNMHLNCRSRISTLHPFLDKDGILRVKSRLQYSELSDDVINPILLPKHGILNDLLIRDIHVKMHHGGVNLVLSQIRQRFWIVKARQLIKKLLKSCVVCQKLRGKSGCEEYAPLPRERVLSSRAFEVAGIDFAGPLYVDKSKKKVYILLVTCATTRAIHLEMTSSLTTEEFLNALRRFMTRRGVPSVIFSDNAKTFKKAACDLKELCNTIADPRVQAFMTDGRVRWRFIVERAAWWGGWWERLVRSVKDALKASIGRNLLTSEQLHTLLTEVEATINSRPISYVSDDAEELQPLTPAHFLLGTRATSLRTIGNYKLNDINNLDLVQMWQHRQNVISKFRKRWTTEYLQMLRSAHYSPRQFSRSVREGDVVLIQDDSVPRTLWKLGLIQKTFPGRDGKIRACEVKSAKGVILRRPIQLLYPLEVQN